MPLNTNFFHLGVIEGQKIYIQKKIIIANYLSTIFMAIPIFFLILCYLFFPEVAFIFLIGIFIPPLVVFLNYIGVNLLARFLLGGLPTILGFIFYAYLVQGNHILPYGSVTSLFTMVVIAFVLFDIREIIYPILILCLNLTCFLFFPQLDTWFVIPMNIDFLYSDTYSYIGFLNSFTILFFSFLILQKINLNSERENQNLIVKTQKNNQNLEHKQDSLNDTLKQLRKAQVDNHNQTWSMRGVNIINEVIQNHQDSKDLYYEIIKGVSRYLGVIQAGFYLVQTDEKNNSHLILEAECALTDSKLKNTTFLKGEGLVGQVWKSGESILLEEIPEEHISLDIGVTQIKLNALILTPVIAQDNVLGVMEFYLGQKPEKYQIRFVENISKNTALAIQNQLHKDKREEMAKKHQKQKENLQLQYNEMLEQVQVLSSMREKIQTIESEDKLKNKLLDNAFTMLYVDEDYHILELNSKAKEILELKDDNKNYELSEFMSHSILTKQIDKMKFGYIWQGPVEVRTAQKTNFYSI